MIIERALEKLREANGGTLPRDAIAGASAGAGTVSQPTGEYKAPEAKRDRRGRSGQIAPAAPAAVTAPAPAAPAPAFLQVACDWEHARMQRILSPEDNFGSNQRAGAAYRMIRTRLLHTFRSNKWASVAITSPEAGEGKSVTAMNLALTLARDGTSNVFLVDLDMRNPTICKNLGIRPPQELTGYFTGNVPLDGLFFSIGVPNLTICGNSAGNEMASEMLSNNRLDALFAHIKSIAPSPLIIVDLPPVLVTDEALVVAPRVDSMLLVVAEGKTRRDSLARARQLLTEFPSAGVILNRATENLGSAGYYYGYGYGSATAEPVK